MSFPSLFLHNYIFFNLKGILRQKMNHRDLIGKSFYSLMQAMILEEVLLANSL
jgi:hypothetical protein